MATLEIHDARGRVRRARITRDSPAMFGADPMCDVVLDGPGVQPFHGRLRWKSGRFKADASSDDHPIEVNGRSVRSKSVRQGDEIRVGSCRIFLLSVDDGPDHGARTVIREAPIAQDDAPTTAVPRPSAVDYHRMEMAPPSVEEPAPGSAEPARPDYSAKPPKKRRSSRRRDRDREGESSSLLGVMERHGLEEDAAAPVDPEFRGGSRSSAKSQGKGKAKGLAALVGPLDRAPGDERVLTSPMVLGLAGTLAVVVALSVALWGIIARTVATRQFTSAVEEMDAGDYPKAIKNFDRFLKDRPDHERADKARVLRALSRVRQHTGAEGASWGNALQEARAMVEEVGGLEEYRDSSVELATDLRKVAEGLADRAGQLADPKVLAEAESAIALHASVAGPAASSLIERSNVPKKMERARFAIRKARDRAEALVSMDSALKASRPDDAYAVRVHLVRAYPDLVKDREVAARLKLANDQVRKAATHDPSGRPGEVEPVREPLGPPLSLALRLDPGRAPSVGNGAIAYALADGFAFGLDAATGAPLWQVPVGLASPFPPLALAGDSPSALVVDARSDELVRLDGKTGALVWRQELGGRAVDAPLVLGNRAFQPVVDGRVLQIDLASGALRETLRVGRRLARTPVADDSATHLYLLADSDCLFVLTLDPLACVAVEYLGHEPGTVACPPARLGRFFILPEDRSIDSGRWRVFVVDESGTTFREVQEIPVGGWTASTPAATGPVAWSFTDRGELATFAVGLYDAKAPFTPITRISAGEKPEGPAFAVARSESEFYLGSSRSGRYDLDVERGKLSAAWTLREAGQALAPPRLFDRLVVLTQAHDEGPGTSLWGVDARTGQVRWRTVLGSPWPIGLAPSTAGDLVTSVGLDVRTLPIGLDRIRRGGFVEQALPKPGFSRLPASACQRLEVDGALVVIPEPDAGRALVRVGSDDPRSVELPAPLACPALAIGKNLLVPGLDGRAYLIDPRTGTSAADPYVPPFDRSRPIRWRSPVALEGDAVALADGESTIRRLAVDRSGRPRLVSTAEIKLDKPLASDLASTGASVLAATTDGRVRSLAARDLGAQGSVPLEAPRLFGPVEAGGHGFAADSAGNVVAFAPDGRRIWSSKLVDTLPAGPPALLDQAAWFLGLDGSLQGFALADGSPRGRTKLDLLPAGGPIAVGPELVVPAGVGTLRVFDGKNQPKAGGTKP